MAPGGAFHSVGAPTAENGSHRSTEDRDISPQRPAFGIGKVKLQHPKRVSFGTPAALPGTCQSWQNAQAPRVGFRLQLLQQGTVTHLERPGTDQAHLAA